MSSTPNDNRSDDTDKEIATQIKSCEFRPIHPSTPTCPVNPAYLPFTYSYSTNASADCFMKPPFTVEEEHWIVKTDNHPFKGYVLQCWEDMLQSALQQCAHQQHSSMSRTSSEEELTSIFENDNQQSATGTSALPTQYATQPTKDFVHMLLTNKNSVFHIMTVKCSLTHGMRSEMRVGYSKVWL